MSKTLCFTGRRPKDLFGYNKEKYNPIVDKLVEELIKFYSIGYDTAISGGAQGFDQISFWAVNRMKRMGYNIQNIVYIPFKGQERRWLEKGLFGQDEYKLMLSLADEVYNCNEKIDILTAKKWQINSAMMKRNHDMVDSSSLVIGLYPGNGWMDEHASGGTTECLKYTMEKKKTIYQMNPFTLECYYPLEV